MINQILSGYVNSGTKRQGNSHQFLHRFFMRRWNDAGGRVSIENGERVIGGKDVSAAVGTGLILPT